MICTAHNKATGQPCKAHAIRGGNVCHYHGGAAPQVKAAAALRLALLVDPALAQLAKLIKAENETVQLGAVKDVLDRNGLKTPEKIEITQVSRASLIRESRLKRLDANRTEQG